MSTSSVKSAQSKRGSSDRSLRSTKQSLIIMMTKLSPFALPALAFAVAIWIDPYGREMVQHLGDFFAHAHVGEFAWWCFEQISGLVLQESAKWVYSRFLESWLRW